MTTLVTEFTANNNIEFDEAYDRAREYVEQEQAVSVVDVYQLRRDARDSVMLAMYAAVHPEIAHEPCSSALLELVERQAGSAVGLYLGIAAVGEVSPVDLAELNASLGPVSGPARWVANAADPEELYDRIVRWLLLVLNRQRSAGPGTGSLAQDASDTIKSNMPTGADSESTSTMFWGIS